MANTLFPVFFKLENLQLLIVGGGAVGLEKLTAVLKNSPATPIKLVATQICDDIKTIAAATPNLNLYEQPYHKSFLENMDLVIVGVNDKALSRAIRDDCKKWRILVNVADTPDLCDFYLGSVVQKGEMKIAISTNGKSPTFAKRMREILEEMIPDSLDETLENLSAIRKKLTGDFAEKIQKLNEITKVLKD